MNPRQMLDTKVAAIRGDPGARAVVGGRPAATITKPVDRAS